MRNIDHIVIAVSDLDAAAELYRGLGFTLTPRAEHPWGTANRLIQFAGGNFIELLEVDRPELLFEHETDRFSFGAHNRDFLQAGEGMSMLVLQGRDSRADVKTFAEAGLRTYAPFDFERSTTLPDGSRAMVAFSLAFTSHPDMPAAAFFTCHNRFPETFWKPEFQRHPNGAEGIVEVVMAADAPGDYGDFLSAVSGGPVARDGDGIRVACGPGILRVLVPEAAAKRFPDAAPDSGRGPRFIAFAVTGTQEPRPVTPARQAAGVCIEWRNRS